MEYTVKEEKGKETKDVSFPEYIVPAKNKGAKNKGECEQYKWAISYVESIISYHWLNRNTRKEKLFEYANNNVDISEFDHITKFYSSDGSGIERIVPAYIRQVNLGPSILNKLVGEANTMPLDFSVSAINSDVIIQKLEKFTAEATEKLARMVRQQSGFDEIIGMPLYEEDIEEVVLPKHIDELNFATYRQNDEINMQKALNYLMRKTGNANIRYKLTNKMYRDYLITGETAGLVYIDKDDPNLQDIDPRDLGYILSPNSPFIHHGMAAWHWFHDTPQGIMNRFPDLPEEDVRKLNTFISQFKDGTINKGNVKEYCRGAYIEVEERYRAFYLPCVYGNFRAQKRVRVKITTNKYDKDNPHVHFVDDYDNSPNAKYEYRFVEEIWEFVRIGESIYHNVRPIENQNVNYNEQSELDLMIVGIVDNNPSIIEMIQPIQSLRMQAFYGIERLMSQIQGNVLVVDEAIDAHNENNIYNMRVNGIWKVNTAQEGDMQLNGGNINAMKPQVMDMGASSAVKTLMDFITFIDINVMHMTGMNEARNGFVKAYMGNSVMQQAQAQSQMSTQPYYVTWYLICQIALQKMLDVLPKAWKDKEIVKMIIGDVGVELLRIKPDGWETNKYGVFIENNVQDMVLKEKAISMAEQVLPTSNDPEVALSILKMIKGSNSTEAIRIFEQGISQLKKVQEQQYQQNLANSQNAMSANMQKEQAELKYKYDKLQGELEKARMIIEGNLKETEMKLDAKGELEDVKKQNNVDFALIEKELNKNSQ